MPEETITVYSCGVPRMCPKGGEHQWDGKEIEWQNACGHCCGYGKKYVDNVQTDEVCPRCKGNGKGSSGASSTCSKCGVSAIDYDLWNCP